jgi:uncharacterized damage-inducible protein DinB
LREARSWFLGEFNPETLAEAVALVGGERNASFRMVIGYWEMAASLVSAGAIDANAFRAAHGEIFATFSKIQPFISELRAMSGETDSCRHMEAVVLGAPDSEAILIRRRDAMRAAAKVRGSTRLFLELSRSKLLDQYWPRLRSSVESLTEEQVWWRPNEASNSIGNLLLHLNGNVRQWLIASFGRLEDTRDRPAEFAERRAIVPAALLQKLGVTLHEASGVLSRLTEADLLDTFRIQGYSVSGLEAVYHVVEHFGTHHGQILYINKLVRGQDLGFYRELDQTGRQAV